MKTDIIEKVKKLKKMFDKLNPLEGFPIDIPVNTNVIEPECRCNKRNIKNLIINNK